MGCALSATFALAQASEPSAPHGAAAPPARAHIPIPRRLAAYSADRSLPTARPHRPGIIPRGAGDRMRSGLREAGLSQLFSARRRQSPSYVSQPCMSLPVAAMNSRNSSTVTALVDKAIGWAIITQCSGFSNVDPFSVWRRSLFESTRGQNHERRTGRTVADRRAGPDKRQPLRARACSARALNDAPGGIRSPLRAGSARRRSIARAVSCEGSSASRGHFKRSLGSNAAEARAGCVRGGASMCGSASANGSTSIRGTILAASDSRCCAAACHCVARFASLLTEAPNFSISALLSRSFDCRLETCVRNPSSSVVAAVTRRCAAWSFSSVFCVRPSDSVIALLCFWFSVAICASRSASDCRTSVRVLSRDASASRMAPICEMLGR